MCFVAENASSAMWPWQIRLPTSRDFSDAQAFYKARLILTNEAYPLPKIGGCNPNQIAYHNSAHHLPRAR